MSEALKLALILRDMCEADCEEMGIDIYAIGYAPADGAV